ncbi:MAG: urate hydroxylase PuuD [Leptospirales bacterium]|nr:urate hydroxylase PuuD [Leptospirales bacterium]
METVLLDWLQLFIRWLHIIAGVAWIGASFYFVWLNNHLRPPAEKHNEIDGELWAIHGGAFYQIHRFGLAPGKIPKELHWFKWEAYVTWLSGISLLILMYYFEAKVYLIDAASPIPVWQAIAIGVGGLAGGWIVYDLLQRSPIGQNNLLFGILFFALTCGAAFVFAHFFSGRAAYIHVGAMLGTIMVGNVFFNIIPSQQELVKAAEEGRTPDKKVAQAAKNRSLHNNYITLPVLFIMISNHYPFTYGHKYNWIILAVVSLCGALIRHWFNLKGQGQKNYWLWPTAALGLMALALVTAPARMQKANAEPVPFAKVQPIIQKHCVGCHSERPTDQVFKAAPLGVKYDTPEQIKAMAEKIKTRAVDSESMPLGNKTGMTREERDLLGSWIEQGARIQ